MKLKNLDSFMEHLTGERGYPGNSVKIYHNHSQVYEYATGYADTEEKTPFSTSTFVNLYSTTKVITCACAMTLFEKGKFLMTDPLYYYIPEFKDMMVRDKDSNGNEILRPAKRPITIRDLFTMTAGFDYNGNSPSLSNERKNNPDGTTVDYVKAIAKEPLCFDPGDRWQYSLCHDVLGGLIEVVSGKSFAEYLKESILDKCGMQNTGFERNDEIYNKMASQYRYNEATGNCEKVEKSNSFIFGKNFFSGGAGLYSNADDYILFADAMACGGISVTGERILSSATIDLMRTNCLTPEQQKHFQWIQFRGYGYGYGVRTVTDRGLGGILSPVGEFGWCGAAGCMAIIDPLNKLSVFYSMHMLVPQEEYNFPRLRNIVYAELSDYILK